MSRAQGALFQEDKPVGRSRAPAAPGGGPWVWGTSRTRHPQMRQAPPDSTAYAPDSKTPFLILRFPKKNGASTVTLPVTAFCAFSSSPRRLHPAAKLAHSGGGTACARVSLLPSSGQRGLSSACQTGPQEHRAFTSTLPSRLLTRVPSRFLVCTNTHSTGHITCPQQQDSSPEDTWRV